MSVLPKDMPPGSCSSLWASVRTPSENPDSVEFISPLELLKDYSLPLAVSKRRAAEMVGSPKLVQRWLYWSRRATSPSELWVRIVQEGGRGQQTLIDFRSLRRAYDRFAAGDEPPLMPSERRAN